MLANGVVAKSYSYITTKKYSKIIVTVSIFDNTTNVHGYCNCDSGTVTELDYKVDRSYLGQATFEIENVESGSTINLGIKATVYGVGYTIIA